MMITSSRDPCLMYHFVRKSTMQASVSNRAELQRYCRPERRRRKSRRLRILDGSFCVTRCGSLGCFSLKVLTNIFHCSGNLNILSHPMCLIQRCDGVIL